MHGLGLALGVAGGVVLTLAARPESAGRLAALIVYVTALVTMFACSTAYNLAPLGPRKRLLRRFDHAAIYLLIAGTYAPFAQRMMELGTGRWPASTCASGSRA